MHTENLVCMKTKSEEKTDRRRLKIRRSINQGSAVQNISATVEPQPK